MANQDRGPQPPTPEPPAPESSSSSKPSALNPPLEAKLEQTYESFDAFVDAFRARTSLGGMFIATPKPRPVGTEIRFKLTLEDGYRLLRGIGEVAWVRPKAHQGEPPGMGIRFLALDESSRSLVLKMLEEQVKAGGQPFEIDAMPPGAHAEAPDQGQQLTLGDLSEDATLITGGGDPDATRMVSPADANEQLGFDAPWGERLPEIPTELVDEDGAPAAHAAPIALGPPGGVDSGGGDLDASSSIAVDPDVADPELDETDFGFALEDDQDPLDDELDHFDSVALDHQESTQSTQRAEEPPPAVQPVGGLTSVKGGASQDTGRDVQEPVGYPAAFDSEDPTLVTGSVAAAPDLPFEPEGGFDLTTDDDGDATGGRFRPDEFAADEYGVDFGDGSSEFDEDSEISFAEQAQAVPATPSSTPSNEVPPVVAPPADSFASADSFEPPAPPAAAAPPAPEDVHAEGAETPHAFGASAPGDEMPALGPFDTASLAASGPSLTAAAGAHPAPSTAPTPTPTPTPTSAPSFPEIDGGDLFDAPAQPDGEPGSGVFAGGWADESSAVDPSAGTDYDYDDLETSKRGLRGSLKIVAVLGLVLAVLGAGYWFRDTLAGLVGLGDQPPVVASGSSSGGSPSASGGSPSSPGGETVSEDDAVDPAAGGPERIEVGVPNDGAADVESESAGSERGVTGAAAAPASEPSAVAPPRPAPSRPAPPSPTPSRAAAPTPSRAASGVAATEIRSVDSTRVTGGTRVVIELDGTVRESQIDLDRATWAADREILKLSGVGSTRVVAHQVGTPELAAVRLGVQPGNVVHVVFDLGGGGARVADVSADGSRIQVLVTAD